MTSHPEMGTVIAVPDDLQAALKQFICGSTDVPSQVAALNAVRELLHDMSPFAAEPVDMVRWVLMDTVQANTYNPNQVAPPEMDLLRLSIHADGYTQPIVTNQEGNHYEVVDGFHRNRVGKEFEDIRDRPQPRRRACGEPAMTDVSWIGSSSDCCDLHNRHCEPPYDLCCGDCSEVHHGWHACDGYDFAISHHDGSQCVLASAWTDSQ